MNKIITKLYNILRRICLIKRGLVVVPIRYDK